MGNSSAYQILVSAFACEPGRGSEQEVGWKWAVELAGSGALERVTVLTQTRNRPGIERWMERPEYRNLPLNFEYVQLPGILYGMKSRFDFLTMPYYAAWQWLAMKRAEALLREESFDLVHHLTFATFRVPVWMKRLGLPVVMGPVGGAEQAPWGVLGHRARPGVYLREAFRNVMTGLGVLTLRLFPPLAGGRGVCLAATPRMKAIFGRLGLPVELYPTVGVDLGPGVERKFPPVGRARRFLFVGRLHFLKGLQLLLDAFARAGVEEWRLTLVGSGAEEAALRRQARELGIEERVEFRGHVPREELGAIYREHDVLCAPSLYESGGFSVLEGMEHGLPAIVLDVGGHAVSVTDECGIKVPADGTAAGVIEGLAVAIRRYAEDGDMLAAHSRAARERVEREYAWRVKVPKMLGIYDTVLAGKGRSEGV